MNAFDEILAAVISMAQGTDPYAAITTGALPADNGICMAWASGAPASTFLDKGMAYQRTIVCNGKHTSQQSREQNSQWLYGSSLRVKFYLR